MPCNVTYCESAVAQVSARASYDVLSLRLQARRVSVRCLPSQEEEEGQSKRSLKTKKYWRFCSANTGSQSRRLQLTLRMFSC